MAMQRYLSYDIMSSFLFVIWNRPMLRLSVLSVSLKKNVPMNM